MSMLILPGITVRRPRLESQDSRDLVVDSRVSEHHSRQLQWQSELLRDMSSDLGRLHLAISVVSWATGLLSVRPVDSREDISRDASSRDSSSHSSREQVFRISVRVFVGSVSRLAIYRGIVRLSSSMMEDSGSSSLAVVVVVSVAIDVRDSIEEVVVADSIRRV